ncbi:zinc finger imprinted 3-like [Belonocnema kinseyi]|uniref:zinc finger imprinted 3-like n=1 Tax=Belonocnema kinseyi TaxID=2817044 RepID=UPI00143DB559|nr:zinc finger imprinted 3-like [Belonocnema kinseyi]
MKSTKKLEDEPYSDLHGDGFLGFQTVFLKHESEEQGPPSDINQLYDKCISTEGSSHNKSNAKSSAYIIEYDNDKNVEIKEEIIECQGTGRKCDQKYVNILCTPGLSNSEILPFKKQQSHKKQKNQQGRHESEHKYKCEKCARTYKQKENLISHQKFECGIMPQFTCKFCSKQFKWKSDMIRHVSHLHHVHLETNLQASKMRHNCDKCSRSYTWHKDLYRHKRLEHATVTPQFTCDICAHKTKRKYTLSKHIIRKHLNKP